MNDTTKKKLIQMSQMALSQKQSLDILYELYRSGGSMELMAAVDNADVMIGSIRDLILSIDADESLLKNEYVNKIINGRDNE